MRQFRLIFLLSVALLSSGYRWRCYIFCNEQTGIQNDYVEIRSDCRDYADDNIDSAMADTKDPSSKRLRKAKLVELFSDCMAKHGWDVPVTTVAKADEIPLYESSVSKVAANPGQDVVPAPVIIDNRKNDKNNSQDSQTRQEISQEPQEEQEGADAESSSESNPENIRRQPAVTARQRPRETDESRKSVKKSEKSEKQYAENRDENSAGENPGNSHTYYGKADDQPETTQRQKENTGERTSKTANDQTIYEENNAQPDDTEEEIAPVARQQTYAAKQERKPLPHNPGQEQTTKTNQKSIATAQQEDNRPPAQTEKQQAKAAARKTTHEAVNQEQAEQIDQAAMEKTAIIAQHPGTDGRTVHSVQKSPSASSEQKVAENMRSQPSVTPRKQAGDVQAAPLVTASRNSQQQTDPAQLSNMEPSAGTPAQAASSTNDISPSENTVNLESNKNTARPADNDHPVQAAAILPWKSQNDDENINSGENSTTQADTGQKNKAGQTSGNANTDPQIKDSAKNQAQNISSVKSSNKNQQQTQKQTVNTKTPTASHIAATEHKEQSSRVETPGKTASKQPTSPTHQQPAKQVTGKADTASLATTGDNGQIETADGTQQFFDSSLTASPTPSNNSNVKSQSQSKTTAQKADTVKHPAGITKTQAKQPVENTDSMGAKESPAQLAAAKAQHGNTSNSPASSTERKTTESAPRPGNTAPVYTATKYQEKRATAAPVMDAEVKDLPPASQPGTVAKNNVTPVTVAETATAPENTASSSLRAQQAFDSSAASSPTTHLARNQTNGQAQASTMPSQPAVTAKPEQSPNIQVASIPNSAATQFPANAGTLNAVNDNALAKRISECDMARRSAKTSSNAAAKVKLCDMECAELLKKSPASPRPAICPPKEAAIDLLDNQLAGK